MLLGERQELHSVNLAKLILYMEMKGYKVRGGDWFAKKRTPLEHKKDSNHYIACATDINLFKDGKYLTKTEDHAIFGAYWESLHPNNRWGGRYGDGNHYETMADSTWRK